MFGRKGVLVDVILCMVESVTIGCKICEAWSVGAKVRVACAWDNVFKTNMQTDDRA